MENVIRVHTVNDYISIPIKDIISVAEYDDDWVLIRMSNAMQVVAVKESFDEVNKLIEEVTE